jgi:hypothetical protein
VPRVCEIKERLAPTCSFVDRLLHRTCSPNVTCRHHPTPWRRFASTVRKMCTSPYLANELLALLG